MKVYYECAACFLRQTREALDLATNNETLKMEVTEKIIKIVSENFHKGAVSNVIGTEVHRTIKEETGNQDPYSREREISNDIALDFLPQVEKILGEGATLKTYIKIAIAGNVIDFGALGLDIDMESLIVQTMKKDPTRDSTEELENALKSSNNVLYLADNIGEIVFAFHARACSLHQSISLEQLVRFSKSCSANLLKVPASLLLHVVATAQLLCNCLG